MFKVQDNVRVKSLDEVLEIEGVDSRVNIIHPNITEDMLDTFGKTGNIVMTGGHGIHRVFIDVTGEAWSYHEQWLTKISQWDALLEYIDYLDLYMDVNSNRLIVSDGIEQILLVDRQRPFTFDCKYGSSEITMDQMHKLVGLASDYSSTIDRKYRLELPQMFTDIPWTLNHILDENRFYFGSDCDLSNYKTAFTQSEIDELPHQDFIKSLNKVEVK